MNGDMLKTLNISELPEACFIGPSAKEMAGSVSFLPSDEGLVKSNFRINVHGGAKQNLLAANLNVVLYSVPVVGLAVGALNSSVTIGARSSGRFNMNLFSTCSIDIGRGVTSNGVNIMGGGGNLSIGDDCMFADSISIHLGDNHGVVDVATGELVNSGASDVEIGDHVWIGAGARILKNARIGKGSIVAASSVVVGKVYPSCSLIAGAPAIVKRAGTSWTRSSFGKGWDEVKSKFDLG